MVCAIMILCLSTRWESKLMETMIHNQRASQEILCSTRWASTPRTQVSFKGRWCWCRSWDPPSTRWTKSSKSTLSESFFNSINKKLPFLFVQLQQKEDFEGSMALYSKFQVIAPILFVGLTVGVLIDGECQYEDKELGWWYVWRWDWCLQLRSLSRRRVFNSSPPHTSSSQLLGDSQQWFIWQFQEPRYPTHPFWIIIPSPPNILKTSLTQQNCVDVFKIRRSYATCLWIKYGNKVRRRQWTKLRGE